ncbi:MAG: AEC family transporter [Neisseria sp.]|nr:AEC family transporter [Neisseria sp.]
MLAQLYASLLFAAGITLPSIFLLLFGLFLRRSGQIDGAFCVQAARLMFNWALPALLFFAIVDSQTDVRGQWKLLAAGTVVTLILFVAAEIAARFWVKEKRDRGVFVQGIYRGNTAIIGLAFCANAYGAQGIAVGAVFAGSMTFLYNVLAVITLSRSLNEDKQHDIPALLWQIVKNPLIIAIVLALLCRAIGFRLPETLAQSGHYLAATALPLALICVGATFDMKSMLRWHDLSLWTSLLRVTVAPATALAVGLAFGLNDVPFGVLFLMSAAPVAAAAYVMVKAMGGNDVAAANVIGMTTFLSMISASLWVLLLHTIGLM